MQQALTLEQKQDLYRDGYVIVKNAVPPEVRQRALDKLDNQVVGEYAGTSKELTDLVNASAVTPILHEAMGYFDPPVVCQLGILPVRKPSHYYNNLGYQERDQPYFNAESHMDGLCTIGVPQEPIRGTEAQRYNHYIMSGPKGDIGRTPEVMGHNSVPLFEDPEMTLGMGSFTAFVFVCLNDQTRPGCGQTALLKGAHHETEKFFQWQRSVNGHIGPEGPAWPRLNYNTPNGYGHVYLPEAIRNKFIDETSETTPDGKKWARPTQVLMEAGDACITMFHTPHSGTRNEHGTEPRKSIIFRIRNKKRQPRHMVNGISDHPDRGQRGEWLEYEEGNDPWERSKDALCNMWDEWQGMQEVVAQAQARQTSAA